MSEVPLYLSWQAERGALPSAGYEPFERGALSSPREGGAFLESTYENYRVIASYLRILRYTR